MRMSQGSLSTKEGGTSLMLRFQHYERLLKNLVEDWQTFPLHSFESRAVR